MAQLLNREPTLSTAPAQRLREFLHRGNLIGGNEGVRREVMGYTFSALSAHLGGDSLRIVRRMELDTARKRWGDRFAASMDGPCPVAELRKRKEK